jgi:hypothetical protein
MKVGTNMRAVDKSPLLVFNFVGAGSAEVIQFTKVNDTTAVVLVWWSDQYVVWTIHPDYGKHTATHCHCGTERITSSHCSKCGCEEFEKFCNLNAAWDAEVGVYCAVDLPLARRSFTAKVEHLS